MPTPERRARVEFDDLACTRTSPGASATAREIARNARARLELEGQPIDELRPCPTDGPGGTRLPGYVNAYQRGHRVQRRPHAHRADSELDELDLDAAA